MSESYRGADHKHWNSCPVNLDALLQAHEMEYCNQSEDGADSLSGEWYIADDAALTIISGTFGNDHNPGASHYTSAEVYETEEEYRAALAEWESKPEYTEEQCEEWQSWSVIVGNVGTVCDGESEDEARRIFRNYVKDSQSQYGRAAGESVTLFHGEEIEEEHVGTVDAAE